MTKLLQQIFSVKNTGDKKIIRVLGVKIKCNRFKFQRITPLKNGKPTIAMQVWQMDKGGLEEVVLQLASNTKIREKYNIVIIATHSDKGYLADIARKKGIPVYSFFEKSTNIAKLIKKLNIKIVHFHYDISGAEVYKQHNVKTIYTIHNNYIWMNKNDVEFRKQFYSYIDKFVAVSSQVKEYFLNRFGVDENKVTVIPNGIEYIETKEIEPISRSEAGVNETDFVLLDVASFNLNKYHFVQLAALAKLIKKHPDIKLILIGNIHEQEYYNKILQTIKELHIENNVKLLDYVPKSEVYRYLKMSDAFIMTSITEGFSISMTEAVMFGKPLILTDIGGARDVIKNNDIGFLIKHAYSDLQKMDIEQVRADYKNDIFHFENLDDITSAIENMYLNKDEWKEKGKKGEEKVKNEFNVERVAQEYFEQFNRLLGVNTNDRN